MKRTLFYLIPLLLLGASCAPKSDVTPIAFPEGTFTGQFAALVKRTPGNHLDTIRDSIIIKLSKPGIFAVLGDTIKHAPNKGSFVYNGYYIQFNDSTKVVTGTGSKFHLAGTYSYVYDGTYLQMVRNASGDTLSVQYGLKRKL